MLQVIGREISRTREQTKVIKRAGNGTHGVYRQLEAYGWN
jgi:hypothetical protein